MGKETEALNDTNGDVSKEPDIDWSKVPFWTSQRFITAVVTFWGFACLYLQRVNLSIAMVCMVKSDTGDDGANSTLLNGGYLTGLNYTNETSSVNYSVLHPYTMTTQAPLHPGDDGYCESLGLKKSKGEEGEFEWSKQMQGLLLGSFFWGYLVLQVPGGLLSEKYGPKRIVFFTMLPVAILGLVSPISAKLSPWLFLIVRVLIGVGESSLYPAGQALFSRWSPPSERSRLVGVSLSGGQFGNALIFPIGGFLCTSIGWEAVFYVMGVVGFVWCIVWYLLVFDSPHLSPRISEIERNYIQHHCSFKDGVKPQKTPWKSIFTSLPFWAILVGHTCGNYGLYMLLTQIPTYMKEVLKFDIKSNGVFSMLPYLSMWLCITLAGMAADIFITRDLLTRVWTRKLMTSIGCFGPAACLVGLSFMDCTQQIPAVIMLCGTVGLSGVAFAGYMVNHGDIAPQFAGTLFGITNVAATIPGILAPYIVGAITTNKTREEWQSAFFVASAVYAFGGLFYLIFAKTNVQSWALQTDKSQEVALNERKLMLNVDGATENENRV